ncbi:hypothetical protein ACFQZC_08205 [Streptacidiphilus monticola]
MFVAQLTARTAPPGPLPVPPAGRYATRPEPGPVHLPTTTKRTKRASVDRAALDRLSLLADTGSALTSTLNLEEGLRRVCHVLTQRLADWCVVDLVDEQGRVDRVCIVHRDPGSRWTRRTSAGSRPSATTRADPCPACCAARARCWSPGSRR